MGPEIEGPCYRCGREFKAHDHYGRCPYIPAEPTRRSGHPVLWTLLIILLSIAFLGSAMSFFNPNLNFPVVSQVACSLKGDTWYGGGILGQPGCYAPK